MSKHSISCSTACIWGRQGKLLSLELMQTGGSSSTFMEIFNIHLPLSGYNIYCLLHNRECHCFKNYYRVHINIISPKCLAENFHKVSNRELMGCFSCFLIPLNSLIKNCSHQLCRKYIYLNLVVVFETMTFSVTMLLK